MHFNAEALIDSYARPAGTALVPSVVVDLQAEAGPVSKSTNARCDVACCGPVASNSPAIGGAANFCSRCLGLHALCNRRSRRYSGLPAYIERRCRLTKYASPSSPKAKLHREAGSGTAEAKFLSRGEVPTSE